MLFLKGTINMKKFNKSLSKFMLSSTMAALTFACAVSAIEPSSEANPNESIEVTQQTQTGVETEICEKTKEEELKPVELVFVVDKSGSMCRLQSDTIGSFNSLLEKQKNLPGDAYVTTVMFNTKSQTTHNRVNIQDVNPISSNDYRPSGCTALLDAVGQTISNISNCETSKDHKVMFVIITDGYENASREFDKDTVKQMIEEKTKLGWEFLFCGAEIDAFGEARKIGINEDNVIEFKRNSKSLHATIDAVCNSVRSFRGQ